MSTSNQKGTDSKKHGKKKIKDKGGKRTSKKKDDIDGKKNASKKSKKNKTSKPSKIDTNAPRSSFTANAKRKSSANKKGGNKRASAKVTSTTKLKLKSNTSGSDTTDLTMNTYKSAPVSSHHLSPHPSPHGSRTSSPIPEHRVSGSGSRRSSRIGYYSGRISKIEMISDVFNEMGAAAAGSRRSSSNNTPRRSSKSSKRSSSNNTPRRSKRTSVKFKNPVVTPVGGDEEEKEPGYDYGRGLVEEEDEDGDIGLYDEQFLEILDRMKRSKHEPRIPQIVLIGPRGCGKTSLLEIITGIQMPKGRQCPTICPIEFNIIRDFRRNDEEIVCEMNIRWRYDDDTMNWISPHSNSSNASNEVNDNNNDEQDQDESKLVEIDPVKDNAADHNGKTTPNGDEEWEYFDGNEMKFATPDIMQLHEYIVDAQKHIAEKLEDRDYTITPNALVINVYANHVEDMRVVDLPGWIDSSSGALNVDKKRFTFWDKMVQIYCGPRNNNMIAFIVDAMHDMKECDIFNRLLDRFINDKVTEHHQCIGIISGISQITSEQQLNDDCSWIKPVLEKGYRSIRTFIGVHTFDDEAIELNKNAEDIKWKEQDLLMNFEPWSLMYRLRDKLGSDAVMRRVGKLTMIAIQPELASWGQKLDKQLKELVDEFRTLPPSITAKDAVAAVSQVVHNFVEEIKKHLKSESGFESTVNRLEYRYMALRRELSASRPRLAAKGRRSDPEHGLYTVSDLLTLTAGSHGNNGGKGALDTSLGVRHFVVESVIAKKWSTPSSKCLSTIHEILGALVDCLLQKHVHQIRIQVSELLSKLLGAAKREIETLLKRERSSPIMDMSILRLKVEANKIRLRSKVHLFQTENQQTNERVMEVLAQSWAYFDIASSRYCDNVIMVMQSTLVRLLGADLYDTLNQKFCTEDVKKLQKMLGLDSVQKKKRAALLQQFETLGNNREHIEDMIQRNQQLIHWMERGQSVSPSPPINLNINTSGNPKGDDIKSMTALMKSLRESSPLSQIRPLSDKEMALRFNQNQNENGINGQNGFSTTKSEEEEGTETDQNHSNSTSSRRRSKASGPAMQTSIASGEDDYGGGHPMDELVPVDFYSDYMEKKKQLDIVVPKLAQINAQLEAERRKLEMEGKQLQMEQQKLQSDRDKLAMQQEQLDTETEAINDEYAELEAFKDEFEREKEEWAARRDAVQRHIAMARGKLEEMTRKLIEEKNHFERARGLNYISSPTDHGTMVSLPGTTTPNGTLPPAAPPLNALQTTTSIPWNVSHFNNMSMQQNVQITELQKLKEQLKSQQLLMQQLKEHIIAEKESMNEERRRLGDRSYLKQEWEKLDAEKEELENQKEEVTNALSEIEGTMLEIFESEEENNKERDQLERLKHSIHDEQIEMNQREVRLKQREMLCVEKEQRLKVEIKRLREELKVNKQMYRNQVQQMRTKNKLLMSRNQLLVSSNATPPDGDGDGMDDLDDDSLMESDESYDLDFYAATPSPTSVNGDGDGDGDVVIKESENKYSLFDIDDHDGLHFLDDFPSDERRATPIPNNKNKKQMVSSMAFGDAADGLASKSPTGMNALTSIESKMELVDDQKPAIQSMVVGANKTNSQMKRHREEEEEEEGVELNLLTVEMMEEFDLMIAQQHKLNDDIVDKLHSTFKFMTGEFEKYIKKNVELLSDSSLFMWTKRVFKNYNLLLEVEMLNVLTTSMFPCSY